MSAGLHSPVTLIPTVGTRGASMLARLGIQTIGDLLTYWPVRYEDYRSVVPIADLQPGDQVSVSGTVRLIGSRRSWKRKMVVVEAIVGDDSGEIKVVWFNQVYLTKTLQPGETVSLAGKVQLQHGELQLNNPTYEKRPAADGGGLHTGRLVPIYNITAGLTQKQLRFYIHQALRYKSFLEDQLSAALRAQEQLIDYTAAVQQIHFPQSPTDVATALDRLKFEELYGYFWQAATLRQQQRQAQGYRLLFDAAAAQQFTQSLPFTLTDAQKKAAWAVLQDLQLSHPMQRLLQGDVGSGKTVVAAMAMHQLALQGRQSVMLAPTDILAQQHFKTLQKWLEPLNIHCALVTRTNIALSWVEQATRAMALKKIANGDVQVIIGTHSLLQSAVKFKNLSLVIVDEQHRFGVAQRQQLAEKKELVPHLLSMSATPIPRSLAQTLFGDLDLSIIDELPPGRIPVATTVIAGSDRSQALDHIRQLVATGQQAYVVCPLVDESDLVGAQAATTCYQRLVGELPDCRIGLVHGKLKPAEKQQVMADFHAGTIQILVSTSVIEVGVDVPNATVMMIEDAERFGLAQLHQLRGRVGRNQLHSFCYLCTQSGAPHVRERLDVVAKNHNGFIIAEYDLRRRGAGDRFGLRQSGAPEFRLADLYDYELMRRARMAVARELGL